MHVSGCTDDLDAMCEGRRGNRLITCCHAFATSCLTYGEAVAFDPKTGVAQTTLKLGAPAYIAPAAYNGALYVLTDTGQLICIR